METYSRCEKQNFQRIKKKYDFQKSSLRKSIIIIVRTITLFCSSLALNSCIAIEAWNLCQLALLTHALKIYLMLFVLYV